MSNLSTCSEFLKASGMSYPRTCVLCGLGGCKYKMNVTSPPMIREVTKEHIEVLLTLIELTRAVQYALEDSKPQSDGYLVIPPKDVAKLNACLAKLRAWPEAKPGYHLGEAGKAQWALKELLG